MQLCSHLLWFFSFIIFSLYLFHFSLFTFHTHAETQATKQWSFKVISSKLTRFRDGIQPDIHVIHRYRIVLCWAVKYPSMHKTWVSIWLQSRDFNIKDQKPSKRKHTREGSLQWLEDTAYVLRLCNRMELFGENTQRIPETGSYKTLHSRTVWHKGKILLFTEFTHRFNLGQRIRDCHTNQLQTAKVFFNRLYMACVLASPQCSSTRSERSGTSSYSSHHLSTSPQTKSLSKAEGILSSWVRNC